MSDYPEHERLKAISDKSQAIGEFVEWLGGAKGIVLAENIGSRGWDSGLVPTGRTITALLAEFYEIDLDVIEHEKRAMLDALRAG